MAETCTNLSDELKKAITDCGKWLLTAKYRVHADHELCDDQAGLNNASREFTRKWPWAKVRPMRYKSLDVELIHVLNSMPTRNIGFKLYEY